MKLMLFGLLIATMAAASASVSGQAQRPATTRPDPMLVKMADAAEQQQREGDTSIRWSGHFMKGAKGLTYMPFTVGIDAQRGAFESVGVYVRVAARPVYDAEKRQSIYGSQGAPASAWAVGTFPAPNVLSNAGSNLAGARRIVEESYTIQTAASGDSRLFRGAVALPAGTYDLYIALKDRKPSSGDANLLLKQSLTIPDFSKEDLSLSSIILVDTVETLPRPVTEKDRSAHPYALGTTNIIPRVGTQFTSRDELSLAFLVYNAVPDERGKPDVEVEYRLIQEGFAGARAASPPAIDVLDATTLPAEFDLRAGHQLAPMRQIPLSGFPPGEYRVLISVTDQIRVSRIEHEVRFTLGR